MAYRLSLDLLSLSLISLGHSLSFCIHLVRSIRLYWFISTVRRRRGKKEENGRRDRKKSYQSRSLSDHGSSRGSFTGAVDISLAKLTQENTVYTSIKPLVAVKPFLHFFFSLETIFLHWLFLLRPRDVFYQINPSMYTYIIWSHSSS